MDGSLLDNLHPVVNPLLLLLGAVAAVVILIVTLRAHDASRGAQNAGISISAVLCLLVLAGFGISIGDLVYGAVAVIAVYATILGWSRPGKHESPDAVENRRPLRVLSACSYAYLAGLFTKGLLPWAGSAIYEFAATTFLILSVFFAWRLWKRFQATATVREGHRRKWTTPPVALRTGSLVADTRRLEGSAHDGHRHEESRGRADRREE